MLNPDDVAAVVVLYYPDAPALRRLIRYGQMFGKLFVVDNTDSAPLIDIPLAAGNVSILRNEANLGVASALNSGVTMAAASGFQWVVLLDQDSDLSLDALVATLVGAVAGVGIVSPLQISKPGELVRNAGDHGFRDVMTTMTSGSILSVSAFLKCGPFEERLFIDHVDHEYCLRLARNGFRVVICLDAILLHSLGEVVQRSFLGYSVQITSHKPFRLYFFVRNGIHVAIRYAFDAPQFSLGFARQCLMYGLKALFFERDSMLRLRMMARGVIDWGRGRYGRKYV